MTSRVGARDVHGLGGRQCARVGRVVDALSGGGATLGMGAIEHLDRVRRALGGEGQPRDAGHLQETLAGGIAGGVSRTAAPPGAAKILQQVAGSTTTAYNGVWSGLSHIWRTEGVAGMFKGNGANCIRIVPNSALQIPRVRVLRGRHPQARPRVRADAQLGTSRPASPLAPDGHGAP